jgi:hypothetical protein
LEGNDAGCDYLFAPAFSQSRCSAWGLTMPGNLNGTSFWTAVFGLIAALLTLVATVGGLFATSQGGTSAGGNSGVPTAAAADSATATPVVSTATPTPIRVPTATPTPVPSPELEVWSEGTLQISLSSEDSREGADFDDGDVIRADASEATSDSDIFVTETEDGIVIEPGLRQNDEDDFGARFFLVGAGDKDINGCAASARPSMPDQQLLLFSEIDVGDHMCLMTTEDRPAEFELVDAKLTGRQRWLEIRYTTWVAQ